MDQYKEQMRNEGRRMSQEMRETAAQERHHSEQLARRLSIEAMRQWQRSLEGMLAFPTATALGIASTALYVAALVERGFEIFQQSTEVMQNQMEAASEPQDRPRRDGGGRSADVGGVRTEGQREEAHA